MYIGNQFDDPFIISLYPRSEMTKCNIDLILSITNNEDFFGSHFYILYYFCQILQYSFFLRGVVLLWEGRAPPPNIWPTLK